MFILLLRLYCTYKAIYYGDGCVKFDNQRKKIFEVSVNIAVCGVGGVVAPPPTLTPSAYRRWVIKTLPAWVNPTH
jgi:hypothetical protein